MTGRPTRPPEQVARVLELFNAGGSASEVAAAVGREFGEPITRSVVLGIVHRNRARVTRAKVEKSAATRRARRMAAEIEAATPKVAPTGQPCGARAATVALGFTSCRWPHGDPRSPDFHYCTARRRPGQPYCARHLVEAAAPKIDTRSA